MLERTRELWPPEYSKHVAWRVQTLDHMHNDDVFRQGMREFYQTRPAAFISHWIDTIDPRNAAKGDPTRMPFILFKRQRQMVEFFHQCLLSECSGLVEKSRDTGATWAACAFSVWVWLFYQGASVGWGSRKEQLVDRIGDIDSIFEKLRVIIQALPPAFRPLRYDVAFMKLINHDNGASITGESGDEIGRGGRKLIYFVDEAAHIEHPELVEAALSENTRVRVDISSVMNGTVFQARREAGYDWEPGQSMRKDSTAVFVVDWRDHPMKSQQWYDERRSKFQNDGLLHIFAQEVDRDYSAAVTNNIIRREWIASAVDAHSKLGVADEGQWVAGLDVADGGGDRNAVAKRKGGVLKFVDEWGERDTGLTARRAVDHCRGTLPIEVFYDCIGVGAGVKAETNRLNDENLLPKGMVFVPWDAGSAVLMPDSRVVENDTASPINKDFYGNLKAQGWWNLRRRFEQTHRAVSEGIKIDIEKDLISIDLKCPRLRQIEKELTQPTTTFSGRMRLLVEKTPEGARSPNIADAIMMAYYPSNQSSYNWRGTWIS